MTRAYVTHHWYAAAIAMELAPGQLLRREVLETPLVIYRGEDGRVGALEDRCPHRNVALSLGCVRGANVQCGYHGLQFDARGQCVQMPTGEAPPPVMRVRACPALERHGYVWVWMGEPERADPQAVPDYHWQDDPAWTGRLIWRPTACNYELALENVLDLSHTTFVHGETVGSPEVARTPAEVFAEGDTVSVRRVFPDNPLPPIYRASTGMERADRTQTITYFSVNCVRLSVTLEPVGNTDPAQVRRLMFGGPYTPQGRSSHLHFSSAYRNFNLADESMTEALIGTIQKAFAEDVPFLESQQRMIDEGRAEPNRLFSVDKGPAMAMRLLRRALDAQEGRPAAAPQAPT